MSKFEILTASLPDRKEVVVEIFYENILWVELNQEEEGKFKVEFYNHPKNECWKFCYDEAIDILEKAKNRLASMKIIDNDEYGKLIKPEKIE